MLNGAERRRSTSVAHGSGHSLHRRAQGTHALRLDTFGQREAHGACVQAPSTLVQDALEAELITSRTQLETLHSQQANASRRTDDMQERQTSLAESLSRLSDQLATSQADLTDVSRRLQSCAAESQLVAVEQLLQTAGHAGLQNSDDLAALRAHFQTLVRSVCEWQHNAARSLARVAQTAGLDAASAVQLPDIPYILLHGPP